MQKIVVLLLVCITTLCLPLSTFAQRDTADKIYYRSHSIAKHAIPAPSLILVQLKSGHSKLEFFGKYHQTANYNETVKEVNGANQANIMDFQDHFSYCPVYYYIDTNAHFIKNKQFEGILLNADGTIANNIKIPTGDTTYLIAFYDYPSDNPYSFPVNQKSNSKSDYAYGSGYPFGKGLTILNHNFIQVDYYYTLPWVNPLRRPIKNYEYRAKKFDIDYFPRASTFDRDLKENLPR